MTSMTTCYNIVSSIFYTGLPVTVRSYTIMFTSSISKFDSFSVQFGFLFFAIICKTLAHLLNSKCYDTVKMSTHRLYTCVYGL